MNLYSFPDGQYKICIRQKVSHSNYVFVYLVKQHCNCAYHFTSRRFMFAIFSIFLDIIYPYQARDEFQGV